MPIEKMISVLGLVTILAIAYLFSQNRAAIKKRTIVWGLGLQFLLAVVILKTGLTSQIALAIFFFLILLYIFEPERLRRGLGLPTFGAGLAVAAGIAVAAFSALAPTFDLTKRLLIAALLALLVSLKFKREWSRFCFAAILVLGLGLCFATGTDGRVLFDGLSGSVTTFLSLSNEGAKFLFGNLADEKFFFPGSETWPGFGFQFAFAVLPTIIFFSAFMSVMYYLGIIQIIIGSMAKFMHWTLQTSGSETVSCTANIFVGQTEAPFLIKPFLKGMTISELHAVMVGGFATIAGGVLAGYIKMGIDPGYLIGASVMAAPAALLLSKVLYPETEVSQTSGAAEMPQIETSDDIVDAAAAGASDGVKLAINVAAMLVAFISLVAFANVLLNWVDGIIDGKLLQGAAFEVAGKIEHKGIFPGSLQTFFGTLLAPLAFLLGVPWKDAAVVGNLLGVKLSLNEFVAYLQLAGQQEKMEPVSRLIATYALCGFANLSSIGIQIGGISALQPELRPTLAKIGFSALLGGAMASMMTASIAALLFWSN